MPQLKEPTVESQRDLQRKAWGRFATDVPRGGPTWLASLRAAALDRFQALGFPAAKHEEWRSTSIAPIVETPYLLATRDAPVEPDVLRTAALGLAAHRLVIVNGEPRANLTTLLVETPSPASRAMGAPVDGAKGLRVEGLLAAIERGAPAAERYLAKHPALAPSAFAALNTASFADGAYIEIPDGVAVEEPIHIACVSAAGGEPRVSFPRTLIVAGRNSRARVVESFVGSDDSNYFTCAVTEIVLGEGAVLEYTRIEDERETAYHVGHASARLGRASDLQFHSVALGSRLARIEVALVLEGEGANGVLDGLYMARGTQHIDNHTEIVHASPACGSREFYRGILAERAHGVFHGKILVKPGAQKTDSKQTNQALLLSRDAEMSSKPQLEIYADDVKCTHGATIGQIDEEALFYLRSRGIGRGEARGILIHGFASETLGRMQVEPLRHWLGERIRSWLPPVE